MSKEISVNLWVVVSLCVALIGAAGAIIAAVATESVSVNIFSEPSGSAATPPVIPSEDETTLADEGDTAATEPTRETISEDRADSAGEEETAPEVVGLPDGTVIDCTEEELPEECSIDIARLDGQYPVEGTILEVEGAPAESFSTETRVWTFDPRCSSGPCGGGFASTSGFSAPFDVDGDGYFIDVTGDYAACNYADLAGTVYDQGFLLAGGHRITIDEVTIMDGDPVVSRFTSLVEQEWFRAEGASERYCAAYVRLAAEWRGEFLTG